MPAIETSERSSHVRTRFSSVYPNGARSVCPDRHRRWMYSHASGSSSPWRNSATRTFRSESRARASKRTYRTDSPGSTAKPRFSICFRAAALAELRGGRREAEFSEHRLLADVDELRGVVFAEFNPAELELVVLKQSIVAVQR